MSDPLSVSSSNSSIPPTPSPPPPTIDIDSSNSQMVALDLDDTTSTTNVDTDPIVGGGDTQYSRKQLRLVNTLHDIGLDQDIDLPVIVVIGSQSSGKSSLIQAISGVTLPRAPGVACTRCPIECRLMHGDGVEWSCRVFLRRTSASDGQGTRGQTKQPFGGVIHDRELLEDLVLRAQLAILNPGIPAERFSHGDADLNAASELSFSPDIVCLEITGPDYTDISFVDLPGLIRNVGTSGNPENIQLIENLAASYISRDNCIILMTITCETDFANQGAYEIARRYDKLGNRTVGVLTKPDRCPDGAHEKWVRYISGDIEPLHHGWFCVKLHDTQSRQPQPSLELAREHEDQYFNKTDPWRGLPRQARSRLRTKSLIQHLEIILSELISRRIPDISVQIREMVESTTQGLERLGHPPSEDGIGEINALVDQLVSNIKDGITRASGEGNVLYRIEEDARRFKSDLRATCPEFRAWSSDNKGPSSFTPLPELLLEDGEKRAPTGTRKVVIYLDEVLNKKIRSSGRGLPDGSQNEVAEEYLRSFTARWNVPTNKFVTRASSLLRNFIHEQINIRCGQFSHGGLVNHLREAIEYHLGECIARTSDATSLLLKLERSGHTRNERYYRECKDAFLTQLKIQRDLASKNSVLRDLHRMASQGDGQAPATFVSAITQAKSQLSKAGFPPISELELAKLLRPEASDSALEDMAKASAGFEVSLHRFVDYVPLVVDMELVRGVCQDLTATLRTSFRLGEPNALERCRDLLREPQEVQGERYELRQKLHRLTQAEDELRNFWGP